MCLLFDKSETLNYFTLILFLLESKKNVRLEGSKNISIPGLLSKIKVILISTITILQVSNMTGTLKR